MKNTILLGSALILVILCSCITDESKYFHYEWVFDTTDSLQHQSPKLIMEVHKNIWGLANENNICPHQIRVTITGIDQTSRHIQKTFDLDAKLPAWKFRRLDRLKAQKQFIRDLTLYVKFFTRPTPASKYSKMHRNLELPFKRLANSIADHRYLYVFGDGIQNNPKTVSFYPYKEEPEILIQPALYDSLSNALLTDTPLPRLNDISIKLISVARIADDELSFWAFKFWEKLYREAGSEGVEIMTNF